MSPFTVLTLIISYATVTLSQTFTPFQDSISAQGLLGSYFGIPGSAKFDYVIVGGGTAGLTLANRLAANGSYSVAVIEAGGFSEMDNGNASAIPGSAGSGLGWDPADINPLIDWEQYTTPQPVRSTLVKWRRNATDRFYRALMDAYQPTRKVKHLVEIV